MADLGAIGRAGGLLTSASAGVGGYSYKFPGLWQSTGVSPKRPVSMDYALKIWSQPSALSLFSSVTQHTATMKFDGACAGQFLNESATPIVGGRVYLFRRSTGERVGTATTDSAGNFSFSKLMYDAGAYAGDYVALFIDPAGGTVYNDVAVSQFTMGP